jgi:hypothetical protein
MQCATIPKGTTHHTKTDEQEEMQRPTHDCQAHGYVHEILRPRVVPTILVKPLGCCFVSPLALLLVQHLLKHLVDKSGLDDILMCPMNLKDHIIYVRETLCILWPSAHKKLISFGFEISSIGIEVNYSTFGDIHKWHTPTKLSQARHFHSIAIFHTRFMKNTSTIVCLLNVPLVWDNPIQHPFCDLHMRFHYTSLLVLPKIDYTDTILVLIFVDFHSYDDFLSNAKKIGIPKSSM